MVTLNKGRCYEPGENAVHLEQWRRTLKEAAEERITAVETQRARHQALQNGKENNLYLFIYFTCIVLPIVRNMVSKEINH